jgi:hypothetical protein
MPDETRSQPEETESERRPSHLNEDDGAEVEGHRRPSHLNEDDDSEGEERRPSH